MFRPKATVLQTLKTLCDNTPNTAYWSIGKSYKGADIYMFRFGTSGGGIVLATACVHGWEDLGSNFMIDYANWLVSSDANAKSIMAKNYTLLIPFVNMDSTERPSLHECGGHSSGGVYGVDLNRNFVGGWSANSCVQNGYHGASAGSEPETKALRTVFSTYHPAFALDIHYGGGTTLFRHSRNSSTKWNTVRPRIEALQDSYGVGHYPYATLSGNGMLLTDAAVAGAQSFLLEADCSESGCYPHTKHGTVAQTLAWSEANVYPKIKAIMRAFSEQCGKTLGKYKLTP